MMELELGHLRLQVELQHDDISDETKLVLELEETKQQMAKKDEEIIVLQAKLFESNVALNKITSSEALRPWKLKKWKSSGKGHLLTLSARRKSIVTSKRTNTFINKSQDNQDRPQRTTIKLYAHTLNSQQLRSLE